MKKFEKTTCEIFISAGRNTELNIDPRKTDLFSHIFVKKGKTGTNQPSAYWMTL